MLKNYFKIAIAVLKRRKFFTFISLFGISFTLMILMVMTAFVNKVIADTYPDRKRDRSLYINQLQQTGKGFSSSSPPSYYFLRHFAGSLKKPVNMTIFSGNNGTNTYLDNRKVEIQYKYTDAAFWQILEFEFLEGKGFTSQQADNAEHVAVITDDLRREYFGEEVNVVGKYIEVDDIKLRVCGVVKGMPSTTYMMYSDVYIPYTLSKEDIMQKSYHGRYLAILLAASPGAVDEMQKEFDDMIRRVPPEKKEYDHLYCHADPYIYSYVRTGDENSSGFVYALTAIIIFVLIVMVLPTINLVNINITRIMERSSEIGVRKAFGASSRTLVYQFIIENLILTILGGFIGLIMSGIVLLMINHAHLIANLDLSIDVSVLLYSVGACILFGLLSGVYPAWRMSRLNVVTALKAQ